MAHSSVFSFFSGLGFLDLGFEEAGAEIVFVNEVHQPFLEAYKFTRQHTPQHGYHLGSIEDWTIERQKKREIREFVLQERTKGNLVGFIGGPPCPDFSIAGKQKGVEGKNGRLSRTYTDLIISQKPDWFLFENVKGLWRTQRHREFYDSMKARFKKAGYTLSDRLVNSISYGVPQDRDRIILIGRLDGCSYSEEDWEHYEQKPSEEIFSLNWPTTSKFGSKPSLPKGIPKELTVDFWFKKNKVGAHPNAKLVFQPRNGLTRFLSVDEGDDSKKSFKRLHRHRFSPTAAYGNNEVHLHPYEARRITVAEALAIQSLPKDFALPETITLSNAFKGVGNGVPFLLARSIAEMILKESTK